MPADGIVPPDPQGGFSWLTVPGVIAAAFGFFGAVVAFFTRKKQNEGEAHNKSLDLTAEALRAMSVGANSLIDNLQETIERLDAKIAALETDNRGFQERSHAAEIAAREATFEALKLRDEVSRYKLVPPAAPGAVLDNMRLLTELRENPPAPQADP